MTVTKACPACKSPAEEVYLCGVFITCSKTGCGMSTERQDNLIDAVEAWLEICKYFPNPVPERDEI